MVLGALFCLGLGWYAGYHEGRKKQCRTDCDIVSGQVAEAVIENSEGV